MLTELRLKSIGPGPLFDAKFGTRLNFLTGDNGLGKSFLLDVAWWAATGSWSGEPALPSPDKKGARPQITASFQTEGGPVVKLTSRFDFKTQRWLRPRSTLLSSSIIIYARIDGGFSVFDPVREFPDRNLSQKLPYEVPAALARMSHALHLTNEEVWSGFEFNGTFPCEGLIRDWGRWQRESNGTSDRPFASLQEVLRKLSPPHEELNIGPLERISISDSRDIPTLLLPYGATPVTVASEGMKRVLGLAYMLVWAWYEHVRASKVARQASRRSMVVLIDELEAHLHPRWQRAILPAILAVAKVLHPDIELQLLTTTHSPLVLASAEPLFKRSTDCCFLFVEKKRVARLLKLHWAKQGDAVGWLTSETFGLNQARSQEAETAIDAAEAFMRDDLTALPSGLQTKGQIHRELVRLLPDHDPFWPRWIVTAEPLRIPG